MKILTVRLMFFDAGCLVDKCDRKRNFQRSVTYFLIRYYYGRFLSTPTDKLILRRFKRVGTHRIAWVQWWIPSHGALLGMPIEPKHLPTHVEEQSHAVSTMTAIILSHDCRNYAEWIHWIVAKTLLSIRVIVCAILSSLCFRRQKNLKHETQRLSYNVKTWQFTPRTMSTEQDGERPATNTRKRHCLFLHVTSEKVETKLQ